MAELQPDALERQILDLWDRERTFARSLERRQGAKYYSFYDGPPYATGLPHYGHILQTSVKDAVTRYWTMRGYRVDRRVGWDCHGLPVENMVEKELGINTKRQIEELDSTGSPQGGIEAFNAACRAAVLRHVKEWTTLLRRLGRWADYDRAYVTMDSGFIESAWWVFKAAWDRGLVYKGLRSSPYCPRCETPLSHHEVTLGYKDTVDPAITLRVRLADEDRTYLLVWTTTPWTLPGNVAVAVHPDLRYVRVRVGEESWILAKDRLAEVVREEHTLEDEFSGQTLVGRAYEPLFDFFEPEKPAYRVVAAPFVSATDGTGLVHIAPAFGEEDFRLAEELDLPILQTVDEHGRFVAAVTPWAGQSVKDADAAIIRELESRGQLLEKSTIAHAYPHCWRCETPLLYLATTSWFISVTKIKDQLLRNAEQIHWVPAHLKDGRFGQGLRDAPDWTISRTRFWGIPLPVWECAACGRPLAVGSLAELEAAGGDRVLLRSKYADPDLHRPYVDRVVLRCAHCGSEARRVPEVLDVWFDSGSMPYGQWHYPFENKELVEKIFPADFVGEALEMTRGWFYTLHVLAGILTLNDVGLGVGQPAFKNVAASGLILAEDGKKLSKRLGNYPDPSGLVAKYGADTLRLFLLSATAFGEDMRFSDRLVGELYRRFTLILWNVWQYYRTYSGHGLWGMGYGARDMGHGEIDRNQAPSPDPQAPSLLDRWVLARVNQLAHDVRTAMDSYHLDEAARALIPFVDDLSTWYVRRSRGREEALPVLREVLRRFTVVAAPFIPFLADHIHRELIGTSVHLADWPAEQPVDKATLSQMSVVRDLASEGHRVRAEGQVKAREQVKDFDLILDNSETNALSDEAIELLRKELNTQNIIRRSQVPSFEPYYYVEGGRVGSTLTVTPELKQENIVRELIRQVQDLRKQAKYQFDNQIVLSIVTEDAAVRTAVDRFSDLLKAETKSRQLAFTRGAVDATADVIVGGSPVWLGVKR